MSKSGTALQRVPRYNGPMLGGWIALALAFLLALVLTRLSLVLAPRLGLLDKPDQRKNHSGEKALGGWIFMLVLPITAISLMNLSRELIGLGLGGLVAGLTGLMDDRFGLSPRAKSLGQLVAALVAMGASPWVIESIKLGASFEITLGWFAVPFTLFWIVGAINALNLIDGLDGLAAGGVLIISAACALLAFESGNISSFVLAMALAGAAIGFLVFNFHPARVFMGDSGSHYLGYWLAILTIQATQPALSSPQGGQLLVPVLLLGLPIVDTAWAIARRLRVHQPIAQADRAHLHHRVLARLGDYRKSVLLLYLLIGIFCTSGIVIAQWSDRS